MKRDRQRLMSFAAHLRDESIPYVAVLALVVVALSSRGMTNEGTVSLQGDMPRYLMNGAYFHDLVRDAPLTDVIGYTYRYFARYPALSLGHHPLLLSLAEAPFFAIFGVSVWSARLLVLCFMLAGVAAWFALVERIYDRSVAFFAALLFASAPYVVVHSREVLSEVPALSMLLVTMYFFVSYCETQQRRDVLLFAICAVLSVYAKHHVILLFPVMLIYFLLRNGVRGLLRRDAIIAAVGIITLLLPLVPITLGFAKSNLNWVRGAKMETRVALPNVLYYINALWRHQFTAPVLLLGGLGVTLGVARRDRRIVLFLLWIVGFYLQVTYLNAREHRYAIYWIPAFCLLAASVLAQARSAAWRRVAGGALVLVSTYQVILSAREEPTVADGYEAAARYVVEHPKGQSVLFSGAIDSGFFVFFVRKHDPEARLVVLRADKTIVTSSLARIVAENRTTREDIHQLLRDFGTGYIVIEDRVFTSPALELLRQELRGPDFDLKQRIPIRTNSDKLAGVDLVVYEYRRYTPARDDAVLKMQVPLMRGEVTVSMGELRPRGKGGGEG